MPEYPRDAQGRFLPGHPGRPVGVVEEKPRPPRTPATLRTNLAAALRSAGDTYLQGAIQCLGESSKTNPADAERLIKIVAPVMPKHYIEGAAHVADLPLESRLDAIVALMSRGEIDVASGTALTNSVTKQIELAFIRPLRIALKDLEAALKIGDRKAAQDALFKLARELNIKHGGSVEGEVVEAGDVADE